MHLPTLSLHSVFFIPNLGSNLISVKPLLKDGFSVNFDEGCAIKDPQGHHTAVLYIDGTFELSLLPPVNPLNGSKAPIHQGLLSNSN